jgi:hypothetical protein
VHRDAGRYKLRRRASRRLATAGLVAVVLSMVLASNATGFKSGRYAGTTDQGTEIGFKATKLAVKKFTYSVNVECDDGNTREFTSGVSAKAPITEKGRFTAEFVTEDESITSVVNGRLKRGKGSGAIDTAGMLPGGWECASSVEWSAQRQKATAAD